MIQVDEEGMYDIGFIQDTRDPAIVEKAKEDCYSSSNKSILSKSKYMIPHSLEKLSFTLLISNALRFTAFINK